MGMCGDSSFFQRRVVVKETPATGVAGQERVFGTAFRSKKY